MLTLKNYRVDPFSGADQSILITGEAHKIPSTEPRYCRLHEIPKEDSPSTLLCYVAGTSSTVTTGKDTYVFAGSPNGNFYTGLLNTGKDGFGGAYRTLIEFDLTGLPTVASSAKIRLYRSSSGYTGSIEHQIHRVTASWAEGTVTWNNQPGHVALPEAVTLTDTAPGWFEFDITDLYNAWKASTYSNYGVMLRTSETANSTNSIFENESGGDYRPQLVVVGSTDYFQEVDDSQAPDVGEFSCHYPTGTLRFNASDAGTDVEIDYYGTGSPVDAQDVFAASVPTSSSDPVGKVGNIQLDDTYFYRKFSTGWKRFTPTWSTF